MTFNRGAVRIGEKLEDFPRIGHGERTEGFLHTRGCREDERSPLRAIREREPEDPGGQVDEHMSWGRPLLGDPSAAFGALRRDWL